MALWFSVWVWGLGFLEFSSYRGPKKQAYTGLYRRTLGICSRYIRFKVIGGHIGSIIPTTEKQMDKITDNQMETVCLSGFVGTVDA